MPITDQISPEELPKARFWDAEDIYQLEGIWLDPRLVKPALKFRSSFQARDDDVILASSMKTGTTWLKSISLCIMQRNRAGINGTVSPEQEDLLAVENPHFLVPTIEGPAFEHKSPQFDLYNSSIPRLLHTHLPYAFVPDSIKNSSCKMVYIVRNPKDTLISMWHFFNSILLPNEDPFPLQKAVDCFCSGIHIFGPYFDHVLQYWVESQKSPEKILFLRYEEMKNEPKVQLRRIAEFLGKPFDKEEEADEILRRCSLDRLKSFQVNKTESLFPSVSNRLFFRKGVVGDWKNYLTPEMEEQINHVTRTKLESSGLFL